MQPRAERRDVGQCRWGGYSTRDRAHERRHAAVEDGQHLLGFLAHLERLHVVSHQLGRQVGVARSSRLADVVRRRIAGQERVQVVVLRQDGDIGLQQLERRIRTAVLQHRGDIDVVERHQVVEVQDVRLDVVRAQCRVSDQPRVVGELDPHRRVEVVRSRCAVHQRADAAYALHDLLRVPGMLPLDEHLVAAEHGAR